MLVVGVAQVAGRCCPSGGAGGPGRAKADRLSGSLEEKKGSDSN